MVWVTLAAVSVWVLLDDAVAAPAPFARRLGDVGEDMFGRQSESVITAQRRSFVT